MTAREAVARALYELDAPFVSGSRTYFDCISGPKRAPYYRRADAALAEARPYIREECAKVADECAREANERLEQMENTAFGRGKLVASETIAAKLRSMTDD